MVFIWYHMISHAMSRQTGEMRCFECPKMPKVLLRAAQPDPADDLLSKDLLNRLRKRCGLIQMIQMSWDPII